MWIYSHSNVSEGANALCKAIGARKIKHEGSTFKGAPNKVVINWGASEVPEEVTKCRIINPPDAVVQASNKLHFFNHLALTGDVRFPPYTQDMNVANDWWGQGFTVVGRRVLNGSGGSGIEFYSTESSVPRHCPLYTKYIPKKDEYRVHFVGNTIIDYQRKALRPDMNKDLVNWKVRNLDGGFIFVRGDVILPDDVCWQAQLCIDNSPLDFGAIDLIYNEKSQRAYVLEVNTAPGLVGSTVESYANALRNYR